MGQKRRRRTEFGPKETQTDAEEVYNDENQAEDGSLEQEVDNKKTAAVPGAVAD